MDNGRISLARGAAGPHNGRDERSLPSDRHVGGDRHAGEHLLPLLAGGAVAPRPGILDRRGGAGPGDRPGFLGRGDPPGHFGARGQLLRALSRHGLRHPLVLRRTAGSGMERADPGETRPADPRRHDPRPAGPGLAGRAAERAPRSRCHALAAAACRVRRIFPVRAPFLRGARCRVAERRLPAAGRHGGGHHGCRRAEGRAWPAC